MTDFSLPETWLKESTQQFEIATSYDAQGDEMWIGSEEPGRTAEDQAALQISAKTLWGHATQIRENIRSQKEGFQWT